MDGLAVKNRALTFFGNEQFVEAGIINDAHLHFALLLYGTTAMFAAMHLFNYPTITLVAVPMVLPQFWSGLMFAHTRVRLGLLASILNHIASNAIVLAVALLGG